jgi:hypothetical protein
VTGDSWIVDIRLVKDNEKAAEYVAKYATKGYDHSATATNERLYEAIAAFRGRRFVIVFGDWKGFKLAAEPPEKGWKIIERLEVLLAKVRQGDPNATRIFSLLKPEVDEELQRALAPEVAPRPPPLTYPEHQTKLWNDVAPKPLPAPAPRMEPKRSMAKRITLWA